MTAEAIAPTQPLYVSPRGLYPFQEEGIAHAYLKLEDGGGIMSVWDTGTGKSHLAMALGAFLFEDDLIDLMVVVAEKNKIGDDEWVGDFAKFTRLSTLRYHGTGRAKRLAKHGLPQVLVSTYETLRNDLGKIVRPPGKRGKKIIDGPLMEHLRGQRMLIVFDESTKLANRTSNNYKVWERSLREFRKAATTRVLELTATPIERDWENAFNQLRLADPKAMPQINEFESYFVKNRDLYDRPKYHEYRMQEFAALAGPMLLRKRKSDPDVIECFPKQVEEARWFDMADDQADLYRLVADLQDPGADPVPGLWTVLRQVANHPMAVVQSALNPDGSRLARMLVDELGTDFFRSISAVKQQGLHDYLTPLVHGQGAKAVVFSFFGQSVLPHLHAGLRQQGFKTYLCHGGFPIGHNAATRMKFRSDPEPAVLLTSDVGARGVNLPESTYVVEYESALTFANRTQRINRCHRIDSLAESVTAMTFFVRGTVEERIAEKMIERNQQTDVLLDDEDAGEHFLTAAERKEALQIARNTHKRRRAR